MKYYVLCSKTEGSKVKFFEKEKIAISFDKNNIHYEGMGFENKEYAENLFNSLKKDRINIELKEIEIKECS